MEEKTCSCCNTIIKPFFIRQKQFYHKFCPECFNLLQKIDRVKENLLNLEFKLFTRMKQDDCDIKEKLCKSWIS
jgi:hypothetical protein